MLDKKIVLISGANRGIGFCTASKFVEAGYTVIFSSRNEKKGMEAFQKMGNLDNIYFHQLDVGDDRSVDKLYTYIEDKFGRLDILINNAAINYDTWQNSLNADINQLIDGFNVNVVGALRLIQKFVPMMKNNKYGRIINVSSGLGAIKDMTSGTPVYGITKAALNVVTIKVAGLLEGTNIKVNSICPGWVKTDMGGDSAPGDPNDSAEEIFWLANDDTFHGKFVSNRRARSW
jgi:NAD(P)-dependent dehydrogenase (short-subunit alcohol dehydrogenase family)